jgi:hypothetical protein
MAIINAVLMRPIALVSHAGEQAGLEIVAKKWGSVLSASLWRGHERTDSRYAVVSGRTPAPRENSEPAATIVHACVLATVINIMPPLLASAPFATMARPDRAAREYAAAGDLVTDEYRHTKGNRRSPIVLARR